jgi:hypothetical protein
LIGMANLRVVYKKLPPLVPGVKYKHRPRELKRLALSHSWPINERKP